MTRRTGRWIINGATLGTGVVSLLGLLHYLSPRGPAALTLPEAVLFWILGWLPELLFRGAPVIASRHTGVALAALTALWLWRSTRGTTCLALQAAIAIAAMSIAALICILTRTLAPATSATLSLLALAAAVRWGRMQAPSMARLAIFAAAALFGLLGDRVVMSLQMTSLVPHPISRWIQVSALVIASLVAVWAFPRSRASLWPRRLAHHVVCLWALATLGLNSLLVTILDLNLLRAWTGPTAPRVLNEFTYDLAVLGDPPFLVWSNRKWVQAIEDIYGAASPRHLLDDHAGFSERIFLAPGGTFDILNHQSVGRWNGVLASNHSPQPDGRLPTRGGAPSSFAWLQSMPWFEEAGPACGYADDPVRNRYLILSEWYSQYAVVDRTTGAGVKVGTVSGAIWPWPFATADPATRVAYMSSPISDGHLYEFNLDSLEVTRKVAQLYLYETVVDSAASVLWGTRPVTGDLVGVDTHSLEVRYHIPVEASVRDVKLDPDTGDLYTCSFWSGNVYRATRADQKASSIGWCGRFCRNLFLDSARRTLWIATAEGLCRMPLPSTGTASTTGSDKSLRRQGDDLRPKPDQD